MNYTAEQQKQIKKQWEQLKKAMVKKERLSGAFRMTSKQLNNRTATVLLVSVIRDYDGEIEYDKKAMNEVQGFDTWTDKQKAESKKHHEERIERFETKKQRFGTKENEAKVLAEIITSSKEFEDFQKIVGEVRTNLEVVNNFIYLRVNY